MRNSDLLKEYHKLPPLEKAVVRLVSLVYGGTEIKNLHKCLKRLPYLAQNDRNIKNDQMLQVIAALKKKGLVASGQECKRSLAHSISIDACDGEYAEQYVAAIESVQEEVGFDNFYSPSVSLLMVELCELRRAIYLGDEFAVMDQLTRMGSDLSGPEIERMFRFLYAETDLSLKWLSERPLVAQQHIFSAKL